MAKDSNAAQRRANKARQQAKAKKVQVDAPKKEPKPSDPETDTAPPILDKQDAPAQEVLKQTLHTQEDQIAALRKENETLQNELKDTQHTLQESHRAFADQMVGISANFDQDKEQACKQIQAELDQVRAELGNSREREQALTHQVHELENKIQTDASAALSPFTALKDMQAQLHVRSQRLTQRRILRSMHLTLLMNRSPVLLNLSATPRTLTTYVYSSLTSQTFVEKVRSHGSDPSFMPRIMQNIPNYTWLRGKHIRHWQMNLHMRSHKWSKLLRIQRQIGWRACYVPCATIRHV